MPTFPSAHDVGDRRAAGGGSSLLAGAEKRRAGAEKRRAGDAEDKHAEQSAKKTK